MAELMDIPCFTEGVYLLSKVIVIPGWLLLVASLFRKEWRPTIWPITQFVLPALLCILYLVMVWDGRHGFDRFGPGTFFDLAKIGYLYTNASALNASWLHFLALDLFAGTWIVRDGVERRMAMPLILLCLPLTLMFAPAGLLTYFVLRFATGRRGAPEAE